MKKVSISLDEPLVEEAVQAAKSRGMTFSAWMNDAVKQALIPEAGLAAVHMWEAENGELSAENLAWADEVIELLAKK